MPSTSSMPIVIEWRLAPKHVHQHTLSKDKQWTRHSRRSPRTAKAVLNKLRSRPDMLGIMQFRIRPIL